MQIVLCDWVQAPYNAHLSIRRSVVMQMKVFPRKMFSRLELLQLFLFHAKQSEFTCGSTTCPLIEELDRTAAYDNFISTRPFGWNLP